MSDQAIRVYLWIAWRHFTPLGCIQTAGQIGRDLGMVRQTVQDALGELRPWIGRARSGAFKCHPLMPGDTYARIHVSLIGTAVGSYSLGEDGGTELRARELRAYAYVARAHALGQPVTAGKVAAVLRNTGKGKACSVNTGHRVLDALVARGWLARADGGAGRPYVYEPCKDDQAATPDPADGLDAGRPADQAPGDQRADEGHGDEGGAGPADGAPLDQLGEDGRTDDPGADIHNPQPGDTTDRTERDESESDIHSPDQRGDTGPDQGGDEGGPNGTPHKHSAGTAECEPRTKPRLVTTPRAREGRAESKDDHSMDGEDRTKPGTPAAPPLGDVLAELNATVAADRQAAALAEAAAALDTAADGLAAEVAQAAQDIATAARYGPAPRVVDLDAVRRRCREASGAHRARSTAWVERARAAAARPVVPPAMLDEDDGEGLAEGHGQGPPDAEGTP